MTEVISAIYMERLTSTSKGSMYRVGFDSQTSGVEEYCKVGVIVYILVLCGAGTIFMLSTPGDFVDIIYTLLIP